MANNIPFFRGKDVILKLYQDGSPVLLLAKNWSVEENAAEVAEGVNGEDRDRLDKVTNYYSATVDVYQSDVGVIDTIMAAQEPDDLAELPLEQHGAIAIRMRDGTKAAYKLIDMKVGPFNLNQGGRTDPVMLNLKMRFRYFLPAPSL